MIVSGSESLPPEIAEISRESLKSMQSEKEQLEHEKWYQILFQVSVPFFIAGIGTIGAGLVMAMVTVSVVCIALVKIK